MDERLLKYHDRTRLMRGSYLPVLNGAVPEIRCGECALVAPANEEKGWKYTRENGWVCERCAKLPRLAYDAPNRKY